MAIYNLPRVEYTTIAEPTDPGVWTSARRLDDLAKALSVPVAAVEIADIKSIPDPWAQPLVFGQALLDDKHEMHASVRGQWRGLLALFGLQAHFQQAYQLKIETLDLRSAQGGNAAFRRVLRSLLPEDSLAEGARWDLLGLVTLTELGESDFDHKDPVPIGLLSPTALVAAGKGAEAIHLEKVPWLRRGIVDPLECEGLSEEQWAALAIFLQEMRAHYRKADKFSVKKLKKIGDALDAFGRECLVRAGAARGAPTDAVELPDKVPHRLYDPLRRSHRPRGGGGVGETRLVLREVRLSGGGALLNGAILVDPKIAGTYGTAAENIRVWENYSLSQLASPARLAEARRQAAEQGLLLLTPDDIFTPALVQLDRSKTIAAHPDSFRSRLLPLSPLALLLLGAEQIADHLEIVSRGDSLEVSLLVDLVREPGKPLEQHRLVRNYPASKLITVEASGDLALWPDFSRDDWRWTFLRFQHNPTKELRTRFALSARGLAELIAAEGEMAARVAAALKWGSPELSAPENQWPFLGGQLGEAHGTDRQRVLHRVRFVDDKDMVGEQHLLPFGADMVFFSAVPDKSGREQAAGCLLVGATLAPQSQDQLRVSVDFGTTNTVVYMGNGTTIAPSHFKRRVSLPLKLSADQLTMLAAEYADFLPLHDQGTPFPTVVKKRMFKSGIPDALIATGGASDEPGVSDNVFFVPRDGELKRRLGSVSGGQLVFQLKWSTDPKEKLMVRRFLRQVMLMAFAEAAAAGILPQNIRWSFSYPQAFSTRQRKGFTSFVEAAWRDLFEKLFESMNLSVKISDHVSFETEGAAALRLFASESGRYKGQAGRLILMLDIGGGTTELAIYRDRKTLWRSSAKVAGGAFFTTFIANNLEVLDGIRLAGVSEYIMGLARPPGSAEGGAGRGGVGAPGFDLVRNAVELFVSSSEFDSGFSRNFEAIRDTKEGEALEICAAVALGGLLHYAGLAMRAMIADRQQEMPQSDLENLTVIFAGRGSAIFKHLGPAEDRDSDLARLCGMFAAAARGDSDAPPAADQKAGSARVTALFSDLPKHEVAEGLLTKLDAPAEKVAHSFLPGGLRLTYREAGKDESLQSTGDVNVLRSGPEIGEIDLAEFDRLLASLKALCGITIDIDHGGGTARRLIENRVRNRLLQSMSDIAGDAEPDENEEAEDLEPPFITALRALIEILNEPLAERDRALRVRRKDPER